MAKKVSEKKASKPILKTNASYSSTKKNISNSEHNPSRYAPGKGVGSSVKFREPEEGLLKLFTDGIKDLYWAENQLLKALPIMARAAGSKRLSTAILEHLQQTQTHVERLETVFKLLGKKIQANKCEAMEGLTKDGEAAIENTDAGSPARDLGIIMGSQKVEHYEIAAYSGLIALAGKIDIPEITDLLSQTLNEEQAADSILAGIAEII